MSIITVTNLFPRPDQPRRGIYNAQLFAALARACDDVRNICIVPEWQIWRWRSIRGWQSPCSDGPPTTYVPVFYLPVAGRSQAARTYRATLDAELNRRTSPGDILYASWLYPDGVAVAEYAARAGRRAWLMVLGSDTFHLRSPARRRQILLACKTVEGIVCVWQGLADRLIAAGVDESKIHVVPNGVDTERFRYRSKSDAWIELNARGIVDACGSWFLVPGLVADGGPRADDVEAAHNRQQKREDGPNEEQGTRNEEQGSRIILWVGNFVRVKQPERMLRAFAELLQSSKLKEQRAKCKVSGFSTNDLKPDTRHLATQPRVPRHFLAHLIAPLKRLRLIASLNRFRSATKHIGTPALPPSTTPLLHHSILLMIGSGPMLPDLQRLAAELGISDRVIFLGNRPHEEVALWMNVADGLCLTSSSEGMPNVVIEALASGCPVVATDVGACRELLEGQEGCRVVEGVESSRVQSARVQSARVQSARVQSARVQSAGFKVQGGEGSGTSNREPRTKNQEPRTTNQEPLFSAAMASGLAANVDREGLAVSNAERFSWSRMAVRILSLVEAGAGG